MVVRLQVELGADALQLALGGAFQCGIAERGVFVAEDRRGIHQVAVQEQLEQRISQVVVRGDVAAAAGAGVARQRVQAAHRHAAEAGQAGLHRIQALAVAHQQAHQRDQVVAFPQPVHIRLANADAAVQRRLAVEARIVDAQVRVQYALRLRGAAQGGAP